MSSKCFSPLGSKSLSWEIYKLSVLNYCQKLHKSVRKEAPTFLVTLPPCHLPKDHHPCKAVTITLCPHTTAPLKGQEFIALYRGTTALQHQACRVQSPQCLTQDLPCFRSPLAWSCRAQVHPAVLSGADSFREQAHKSIERIFALRWDRFLDKKMSWTYLPTNHFYQLFFVRLKHVDSPA